MKPTVLGYADTLKKIKGHPELVFKEYSFVKLKKLSKACVPASDSTLPGTTKEEIQGPIDRLHSTVLLHEKEDQNGDMMEHVTSLARSIQY